ncbi:hypothetical protein PILCRDRAFT_618454 [Piloderma croceum F 1598]|uniref:Mid2 domain-containing protein n=1 Tax=Piloderma croceum (strain F 1598) TaxID=765440 RepID=A0A0C3BJ30_PILCF|nr:hypothetical protein PILCRDRAFT_618454 [Piloderma croceum F 1598]
MYSAWRLFIPLVCISSWSLAVVRAQGNTTCKNTSLDWYTSSVGETPCQTYQQLRQICNAAYTVGSLSPATPPDSCNDQVAGCCCNSVSFALSMLCLNCQQGVGSGVNGDNGIDAGVGAYQDYLGSCSPNVNQSLPTDVQAAVCNDKIKIDNDLYTLFWNTGAWFYIYTRETIQKDQQTFANNTFTHCASTTINSTATTSSGATSTSNSVATSTKSTGSSHASSSLSMASIAGIAVGGVIALLLLIGIPLRFLQKRRRRPSPDKIISADMEQAAYQIEPFLGPPPGTAEAATASAASSHPYIEPLETGHSHSSQALLPANSSSQLSSRPEKGRQPVILHPDATTSTGHLPPSSVSQSTTTAAPLDSSLALSSDALPERHSDGGPLLGRSPSGRLPPAYGEIRDDV